jgi:N-methylhydantoinase B
MATTAPSSPTSSYAGLDLHSETAEHIDPITYEVIRHRLWNLNREQATTLTRLSGSPSAIYGHDFNPVVFTEEGEWVFFGPFIQYLSAGADNGIRWTMEHRGTNPGINDGDIFMSSDPWIGVQHAQDVLFQCPVFVDGRIFCWVSNTLHQYDVGGSTPAGFCPDATDAYTEPAAWPPLRVVENFQIRQDIEDLHVRRSRVGHLVSLDLRATIAGLWTARAGVLELVEKYGAAIVKAAMRKVIDDAEAAFLARMERLPDGIWEERSYFESATMGDRAAYPVHLQLEKRGTELYWRNEGTHPQVGALNMPPNAFRGGIMAAVASTLLYDQLYAVGGALRHIHFEPTPGTITAADYPAATSCGPPLAIVRTTCMAGTCLGKMVISDDELSRESNAPGGPGSFPMAILAGLSRDDSPYMNFMLEPLTGSIGAFSWRDGVSTGGQLWNPLGAVPNVEHEEQLHPYLYLYRKELADTGGVGRYRGGNGGIAALKFHKTRATTLATIATGRAAPAVGGMFGGYPGATNTMSLYRDTDVNEILGSGRVPEWASELGDYEPPPNKGKDIPVDCDCVLEYSWSGGGGYGDPLLRDPEAVAADVQAGEVTEKAARDYFAVGLTADGAVDPEATAMLRAAAREARRAEATGPEPGPIHPTAVLERGVRVHQTVRAVPAEDGWRYAGPSGVDLGSLANNYKDACLVRERDVRAVSPVVRDAAEVVDDRFVLREFFDPIDLTLLETEVARAGEPYLWDLRPALER